VNKPQENRAKRPWRAVGEPNLAYASGWCEKDRIFKDRIPARRDAAVCVMLLYICTVRVQYDFVSQWKIFCRMIMCLCARYLRREYGNVTLEQPKGYLGKAGRRPATFGGSRRHSNRRPSQRTTP